jgi:RIP homotypic interaction motif
MDPVTLILTALGTGAMVGAGDTAATLIKDTYQGLKDLVSARFSGKKSAEVALAEHETDPETWQAPLAKELRQTGVDTDPTVIAAAQQLMALLDEAGTNSGKYTIDLRGAQGIQVGDHNQQLNKFTN